MANKKLVERKKKKKAEETKAQKLRRQAASTKKRKEEKAKFLEEEAKRDKFAPLQNEVLVQNPEALANIEKNLQILKALEEEYVKAQKARVNLQQELEAEGFKNLEEKMFALRSKAVESAEKISEENSVEGLKSVDEANDS